MAGTTTSINVGADETHHGSAGACLNCRTPLVGAFCHACGQDAHVHRTLGSIGHDVLHGAFHFEGRIFRTLPLLVRDPGGLTRRYIAGERVRFVQPLALFLFCVFLMFAAIHAVDPEARPGGPSGASRADLAKADAEIARRSAMLAQARALPASNPARSARVASEQAALASLRAAREAAADHGLSGIPDHLTGWGRLDHGIARARDNPELAFYEFQGSAYKYSWALIPLSTPLVALLFLWRRRFTLYDHAIFVTYSLDFMLLFATALTLAGVAGLPMPLLSLLLLVVPPVHIFLQLRGAYDLRRRSALWRTAVLLVGAWAALTAFALLLLGLGLMA